MEFNINWKYPISNGEKKTFTQSYILNYYNGHYNLYPPSFCGGVLISNLINACDLENSSMAYQDSTAYQAWADICGRHHNNARNDLSLSDAMAFPAFCIYKNVYTTLKEIGDGIAKGNWQNLSNLTNDLLGERTIFELRDANNRDSAQIEETIQARIDKYCENYNQLLNTPKSDEDFYDTLRRCIEMYNDDAHTLTKRYLAPKNKESRCFATFVESESEKKYVSFSGTVDAENCKILNWLDKKISNFVNVAKEICNKYNAKFVPIDLTTKCYIVNDYSTLSIGQGLSLDDQINNCADKNIVKDYSCCERKIFGYFNDNTPNGTLYVKMPICARCSLGLIYQFQNGAIIRLCDNLW